MLLQSAVKDYAELPDVLTVEDREVPALQAGQVLIRIAYSTVNPSDLSYVKGTYGKKLVTPCGCGFEGCGEVVSGSGMLATRLIGKKVGFYSEKGAWSEYTVAPAMTCIEMPADMDLKQAASPVVNPLTALAFIDIIKGKKMKSVIHTAAASSLGLMLIRMCKTEGIEVICVVRRAEQAEACKAAGSQFVVDSSTENWEKTLQSYATDLNCGIAFDAVGGELTYSVMEAVVAGGSVHVYGGLSNKAPSVSTTDLIFKGKTLTGFWATSYLKTKSLWSQYWITRRLPQLLQMEARTDYRETVGLSGIAAATVRYAQNMTGGKVLVDCRADALAAARADTAGEGSCCSSALGGRSSSEGELVDVAAVRVTEQEKPAAPAAEEPADAGDRPAAATNEDEQAEPRPDAAS